jgi:predicted phage tail protein
VNAPFYPFNIAGAGGGGKGGGGGGSEAANTLKSRQTAKVVDLLSEGPIRGVVGGLRGIYLNGVALQNPDGSLNFNNTLVQFVNGYPDQPIMRGFESQQAETAVNQQIIRSVPLVRSIFNTDTDRARVTVSVPSLQNADKKGNISGTSVSFRIEVQNNGGGYRWYGDFTISGKTSSKYQRAIAFLLPAPGPWDIRLTRLTPDSDSTTLQNDLYWDSYTALIDDRINYTLSACVGLIIDSQQFSSVPKRTYLTDGILCAIPSNYNPDAATYSGVWDGTFKTDWTDNPAWILYDLIVKGRYGIGDYVKANQVDKWALYKIAQWCDGRVDNGRRGLERRFTCNVQITEQAQAFDLLNEIANVFRGFIYWNGGQLVGVADMPSDPVQSFSNANVINGNFTYSGTDIRARHTMAQVGWNDPAQLGANRIAVVEDQEAISRFGIQKVDVPAIGCTRESQAIRTGNWQLYTEQHEGEVNKFNTGLEGAWSRPGEIIQVSDILVSGERRGGRVGAGSNKSRVYFDAPLETQPDPGIEQVYLTAVTGEGVTQTKLVAGFGTTYADMAVPFDSDPVPDTVWIINEANHIEPTYWRVLGAAEKDEHQYEITATRHYPQKWEWVEQNKVFSDQNVSGIQIVPDAPTDLKVLEYLTLVSPVSVGTRGTISWVSPAPRFVVAWREENGNWNIQATNQKVLDVPLSEGVYEFSVTPYSVMGIPGPAATATIEISGRFIPPLPPLNFRTNSADGVALFEWTPSTELDVRIGGHFELRHSAAVSNATWVAAQTIVPSIPGSASTVETTYRTGSWFLRTFDSTGQPSATWATIITTDPDERYAIYERIEEDPDWLGTHYNTEILQPQNWLTIGATGGLWDQQDTPMDTWPEVGKLPDPEGGGSTAGTDGIYTFFNQFDAGGVFPIRFSTDILAFAYQYPNSFIDGRQDNADDWAEWDDVGDSIDAQVNLQVRTTNDDPSDPDAVWGPWNDFATSTLTARGFQFRALLKAQPGQNIGIEKLAVIGDFREKIDRGDDVVYSGAPLEIPFNIKFYTVPAVVITVQDADPADKTNITAKSREAFTVQITNAGAPVNRTFDWHAMGY